MELEKFEKKKMVISKVLEILQSENNMKAIPLVMIKNSEQGMEKKKDDFGPEAILESGQKNKAGDLMESSISKEEIMNGMQCEATPLLQSSTEEQTKLAMMETFSQQEIKKAINDTKPKIQYINASGISKIDQEIDVQVEITPLKDENSTMGHEIENKNETNQKPQINHNLSKVKIDVKMDEILDTSEKMEIEIFPQEHTSKMEQLRIIKKEPFSENELIDIIEDQSTSIDQSSESLQVACEDRECRFCHLRFDTDQLIEHLYYHLNGRSRKTTAEHANRCSHCQYSTAFKQNLDRHIAIVHHKLKPFNCDLCEYSSCTKQNLTRHLSSKHKQPQ